VDKKDSNILSILQEDATLSVNEIADRVSLSPTACWKRIQRLTQDGIIRKQVCLLDSRKLGAGVTVFVAVKTNRHDLQWLQQFAAGVRDMPEVVEFYRMSGETDYLLKVVVPDIQGFDVVYKKLIQIVELFDVSSSFAMEELKYTTALPLDYL
jgi:Lrp/AsnC family transcriptional regulator